MCEKIVAAMQVPESSVLFQSLLYTCLVCLLYKPSAMCDEIAAAMQVPESSVRLGHVGEDGTTMELLVSGLDAREEQLVLDRCFCVWRQRLSDEYERECVSCPCLFELSVSE